MKKQQTSELKLTPLHISILIIPIGFFINFTSFLPDLNLNLNLDCANNFHDGSLIPFATSQYEYAVKEIQQRISQEDTLFALRFTLIGAILGYLFVNSRGSIRESFEINNRTAIVLWVMVITSSALDIRMAFSAMIIGELGSWIRCLEEDVGQGYVGWETWINYKVWSSSAGPIIFVDRIFITFSIYILAIYASVTAPDLKMQVAKPLILLALVSFAIFGSFYYFSSDVYFGVYVGCALVSVVVMFFGVIRLTKIKNTGRMKDEMESTE